jgi:hypothetical protein
MKILWCKLLLVTVLGDKLEDLKSFDEVLNIWGLCVLIWIKECKYPVCIACYFDFMSLYGLFLVSIISLVEVEQLPCEYSFCWVKYYLLYIYSLQSSNSYLYCFGRACLLLWWVVFLSLSQPCFLELYKD